MDTDSSTQTQITPTEADPVSHDGRKRAWWDVRFLPRFVWGSIAGRLLTLAAVWSLIVLVLAGAYLMSFYRSETERLLDTDLEGTIQTLTLALVGTDPDDGAIVVNNEALPNDLRYLRALSGLYYGYLELDADGNLLNTLPSRSLWDAEPPIRQDQLLLAFNNVGGIFYYNYQDPKGEPLRVAVRTVLLPDREVSVGMFAAVNSESVEASAQRLRNRLLIVMAAISAGVLMAVGLQAFLGLEPLRRIRASLDDIREGREARLQGDYPTEIQPLVKDMNRVLDHNTEVVDRARTHVGNLAHALKNPIAVLMNEPGSDDAYTELVKRHAKTMWQNVDHYLKRAQAAARAEVLGARTEIKPAAIDIARLLERLHRDKSLTVTVDMDEDVVFRGERQDLDDLLGNLMENAAKWCVSKVRVKAQRQDGGILLTVDDDGPGLAPEDREIAMQRGRRLDETAPGTGLGLSIVKELAELYGGSFSLGESEMGGLSARLELPSAAL